MIKQLKKAMQPFAFRLSKSKMVTASTLGIDVAELFRQSLDKEITKRQHVCVTCGRPKKV